MLAIPGIYDGKNVTLKRSVHVRGETPVVVSFPQAREERTKSGVPKNVSMVKIESEIWLEKEYGAVFRTGHKLEERFEALKRIIGSVADCEMSLDEIKSERLARQ